MSHTELLLKVAGTLLLLTVLAGVVMMVTSSREKGLSGVHKGILTGMSILTLLCFSGAALAWLWD
jgi:hypothetical protein